MVSGIEWKKTGFTFYSELPKCIYGVGFIYDLHALICCALVQILAFASLALYALGMPFNWGSTGSLQMCCEDKIKATKVF